LDEAGAGLARDTALRLFRAVERVAAFGLDLGLVTGFSEINAAPSAAPPQPGPGKSPGRAGPRSSLSRSKSPQQRSNQHRKPVISEQESCSYGTDCGEVKRIGSERYSVSDPRNRNPFEQADGATHNGDATGADAIPF